MVREVRPGHRVAALTCENNARQAPSDNSDSKVDKCPLQTCVPLFRNHHLRRDLQPESVCSVANTFHIVLKRG